MHSEYAQLRYAFDLCNKELASAKTPARIKSAFRSRLVNLEKRLYLHKPEPTEEIGLRSSDPPSVAECKTQANRVLRRELADSIAWRVDFNAVFEKFVQHIFKEYARTVGGKLESNPRIRSSSSVYYGWELRQLEPDAVLRTDNVLAFIDAKYKSHLYNRFEASDSLKEEYRRDLHQVLAYTTFTSTCEKLGIVCYPSTEVLIKTTHFRNPYDDRSNRILIIGIPLKRDIVSEAVMRIGEQLDRLLRPQL
jgi:5-methylcytosine-specific restriction endonuclease McrBC regulatory subunit McrC